MGLHTGEGTLGGDDYVGLDVHRAARISSAAHGGQVLVSSATAELVPGLPEGVSFRDLGTHRLKDLARPERLLPGGRGGPATGVPADPLAGDADEPAGAAIALRRPRTGDRSDAGAPPGPRAPHGHRSGRHRQDPAGPPRRTTGAARIRRRRLLRRARRDRRPQARRVRPSRMRVGAARGRATLGARYAAGPRPRPRGRCSCSTTSSTCSTAGAARRRPAGACPRLRSS